MRHLPCKTPPGKTANILLSPKGEYLSEKLRRAAEWAKHDVAHLTALVRQAETLHQARAYVCLERASRPAPAVVESPQMPSMTTTYRVASCGDHKL